MVGTFICDPNNELFIVGKSGLWMYKVSDSKGNLVDKMGPKTAYNPKTDKVAQNITIDSFKFHRPWPTWVSNILTKYGLGDMGAQGVTAVAPGISSITLPASVAKVTDKYNITTPAQPKRAIDPTATLLTFRAQCPHKWLKYVGAVRAYEFCEYCDLKRGF